MRLKKNEMKKFSVSRLFVLAMLIIIWQYRSIGDINFPGRVFCYASFVMSTNLCYVEKWLLMVTAAVSIGMSSSGDWMS